ncbi:MAG: hypothetical protein U5K69_25290 [Balneolaceae bacterium]|nr:hypothetical protein [Balneolaceae bacterium]
MELNHSFWASVFKERFLPQLSSVVETLEKRILSGFEDIEKEADAIAEASWDQFMSSPGTGEEDPSDFAEIAEQAGVSHYILLKGIRQGIINLFSVALYHNFEQQIMLFFRKEILSPGEDKDSELLKFGKFKKRLKEMGINIEEFHSWSKVKELRLIANTVKHGEGSSAQQLKSLRPNLFENPDLRELGLSFKSNPKVFLPLAGEDIYVSIENIQQYKDGLHDFFRELLDAMENA